MLTSVYFSPQNQLDIFEQRLNMLRIPEVLRILRRAQVIIDRKFEGRVDLANFIASEDEVFMHSSGLRKLTAALVQIGLFHRYVKNNTLPDFLVGNSKGEAAVEVVSGRIGLEELVSNCSVFMGEQRSVGMASGGLPILAGAAMPELVVYRKVFLEGSDGEVSFEKVESHPQSLKDIFAQLHGQHGMNQWVNIGPVSVQMRREESTVNTQKASVRWVSSMESDQMLEWFERPTMPRLVAVSAH